MLQFRVSTPVQPVPPQGMLNPTLGSSEPAQKQNLLLHWQQKPGSIHFCKSPSQYWTSTVESSHFDGINLNGSTRTNIYSTPQYETGHASGHTQRRRIRSVLHEGHRLVISTQCIPLGRTMPPRYSPHGKRRAIHQHPYIKDLLLSGTEICHSPLPSGGSGCRISGQLIIISPKWSASIADF
jgi:hypothetical protein